MPTNLSIPDKAGRGDLERQSVELAKDMLKAKDGHEFEYLSRKLDKVRKDFHGLYGVKEHPTIAPLHPSK
jgi:hypothetical protein